MADLYEMRDRERKRLEQMESEANKARDRKGRRSPVDLMLLAGQRNLLPYAVPGGLFLDPFAGSGALVKAAAELGMRTIGYEKQAA